MPLIVLWISGRSAERLTRCPACKTTCEHIEVGIGDILDITWSIVQIQFLLDAALGLINIEQNNVFRVLTVVSVVGVPPTLIASMYGMNFKNMPEYDWHYGYAYGLSLIILSGLVPAIWFKVKGWW